MKFEDLTAVRVAASMRQDDLGYTVALIKKAIDSSFNVSPQEINGVQYTSVMFEDRSVFIFHWDEDERGNISSLDGFLLFAYQQKSEIPQCVKDNSDHIGTMHYKIAHPAPERLQ